jgi:hypothetical protein
MRVAALPWVLAVGLQAAVAEAHDKVTCVQASDDAQAAERAGKLRAAREKLLVCADDSCPPVLRSACAQWLVDVDRSLPTVVLAARDARGADLVTVHVSLDGQPLAERLDGRAVPVDPGAHNFRFDSDAGTHVEQSLVVREGEQNRLVVAAFPAPSPEPATVPPAHAVNPPELREGPPVGAYLLGGVGVLAWSSLTYFGIKFVSDLQALKSSCGAACPADRTDPVHLEEHIADASLVVGVIATAAAAWLFVSPRHNGGSVSVGVALSRGVVSLTGAF